MWGCAPAIGLSKLAMAVSIKVQEQEKGDHVEG